MDAKVNQNQDRIGVLEELLNERYSVRAFLPQQVDRNTIEHVLTTAQRTASWCNSQPWQVIIASGEAKERFRQLIYKEASGGLGDDYDFTPPREYLGAYLERRRESGFQLYNTLGIARGDRSAYARQALENYNFFAARHLRRDRLRRLCQQFHAGRSGARARHDSAGRACAPFRADPPPLQLVRRPPRRLRHLVRLRRQRPQGQQLPHLARERRRHGDVHRGVRSATRAKTTA